MHRFSLFIVLYTGTHHYTIQFLRVIAPRVTSAAAAKETSMLLLLLPAVVATAAAADKKWTKEVYRENLGNYY